MDDLILTAQKEDQNELTGVRTAESYGDSRLRRIDLVSWNTSRPQPVSAQIMALSGLLCGQVWNMKMIFLLESTKRGLSFSPDDSKLSEKRSFLYQFIPEKQCKTKHIKQSTLVVSTMVLDEVVYSSANSNLIG